MAEKYQFSEIEIQQLYDFTRAHFVEYYDLQSELVDHLANGIEEIIANDPSITFENALKIEFKKFGIFGFSDVIESHQNSLSKKYRKIVWCHFLEFLTFPKIVVTVLAIGFTFLAFTNIYTLILLSVLFVIFGIFSLRKFNKIYKQVNNGILNERRYYLKELILAGGNNGIFILFPIQILLQLPNYSEYFFQSYLLVLLASIFFVVYLLFNYVCMYVLPKKVDEFLETTYA